MAEFFFLFSKKFLLSLKKQKPFSVQPRSLVWPILIFAPVVEEQNAHKMNDQ